MYGPWQHFGPEAVQINHDIDTRAERAQPARVLTIGK
jgi:hypothetical protein